MPNKIVDAINILYKDTIAQVVTSYRKTDLFEIIAGVLLVDTIAPYLFIVALDYALREATRDTSTGFMLEKDRGVENLQCTDADSSENLHIDFKLYGANPTTSNKNENGSRNYCVACKLQKDGVYVIQPGRDRSKNTE